LLPADWMLFGWLNQEGWNGWGLEGMGEGRGVEGFVGRPEWKNAFGRTGYT
jgi:hypothetical protein